MYPLLGATMNGWKFVATEIDEESFKCAHDNVLQNKLGEKINSKFNPQWRIVLFMSSVLVTIFTAIYYYYYHYR